MTKTAFNSQLLIKYRAAADLTQAELSKKTGLSIKQLSRYETGDSRPRDVSIYKLASALGCKYEDLVDVEYNWGLSNITRELIADVFRDDEKLYPELHKEMSDLIENDSKLDDNEVHYRIGQLTFKMIKIYQNHLQKKETS